MLSTNSQKARICAGWYDCASRSTPTGELVAEPSEALLASRFRAPVLHKWAAPPLPTTTTMGASESLVCLTPAPALILCPRGLPLVASAASLSRAAAGPANGSTNGSSNGSAFDTSRVTVAPPYAFAPPLCRVVLADPQGDHLQSPQASECSSTAVEVLAGGVVARLLNSEVSPQTSPPSLCSPSGGALTQRQRRAVARVVVLQPPAWSSTSTETGYGLANKPTWPFSHTSAETPVEEIARCVSASALAFKATS